MKRIIYLLAILIYSAGFSYSDTITVSSPTYSGNMQTLQDRISFKSTDFSNITQPGNPTLPFKDIRIILPPEANINSINITLSDASISNQTITKDIIAAPPLAADVDSQTIFDWGNSSQIVNGKNSLIYDKDEMYPSSHIENQGCGKMRGWIILTVRYYPYRYNPATKLLEEASGGNIIVSFNKNTMSTTSIGKKNDNTFSNELSNITTNYSEAQQWYNADTNKASTATTTTPNYTIITTSAIANSSTKLQAFIAHKINFGYNVTLATEAQWGGGTGDTAANNIRAYLKANYLTKNIKYVLLIGNPDPTNGTVPMKMLWPRYQSTTYREAPSDYYYADLTGNWDLSGDGYYGEPADFGTGGIDLYADVLVGRIPNYGTTSELDSILQKIINYESGGIGGAWVRNALLSMKPSDATTPGYQLGEAIKNDALIPSGFSYTRVYDDTYNLNPAPDYTSCTYSNVTTAWKGHAGFHFWWTHGNETTALDICSTNQVQYLDDNYPSFVFQCSCLNGYPELSTNLGYSLLKQGAIATECATRVSWYYPAQTVYSNSDTNAGLEYAYALKMINDHKTCGEAHYEIMEELSNSIWMNRCVFNLYGDPSLSYASGPSITHTPLSNTDKTTPYTVSADIISSAPLTAGYPVLKWSTNGGTSYNSTQMTLSTGITYQAQIPGQQYGTTIKYYIEATDTNGLSAISPTDAPETVYSFTVKQDTTPPVISHTPLSNTGDTTGPYIVDATVTDDTGISSVILYYHKNTGADISIPMTLTTSNTYEANIPGQTNAGDTISYYIVATDSSTNINTTRFPAVSGYETFTISGKVNVAIYNCASTPSYFLSGTNTNAYSKIADILNADAAKRFQVTILTSLTSSDLNGQTTLILPDNGVLPADFDSVSNWFSTGKTIITMDSSTSYAAYAGFMWPKSIGTNGYGTYWDDNACQNDQVISLQDSITSSYSVGQVIESCGYDAEFIINALPSDAKVLTTSKYVPTEAYAIYRDVPGHGRIVCLGPYIAPCTTEYSIIKDAILSIKTNNKSLQLTTPASGSIFNSGDNISIDYQTSGIWSSSDTVKIEYTTGTDSTWHTISGAESLTYSTHPFKWNTSGLPTSEKYKIRISSSDGSVVSTSDGTFTIARFVNIPQAKAISDGEIVRITEKTVTSSLSGYSYIEETDRKSGIRISTTNGTGISSLVNITGTMSTSSGERIVNVDTIEDAGAVVEALPYFMTIKSLGGSAFGLQQGLVEYSTNSTDKKLTNLSGENNIGLYVKICGKVTYSGNGYFYIDDGSNCYDDSGNSGVRIISPGITSPSIGTKVIINGISSTYYSSGNIFRATVLTSQNNLQTL